MARRRLLVVGLVAALTLSVFGQSLIAGGNVPGSWVRGLSDTFRLGQHQPQATSEELAERDRYRAEAAKVPDLERQVASLQTLFDWRPSVEVKKIGARVVSVGPNNFDATVSLDRGTDDGVAVGNPVVSPEGLVGRVVQTSAKTATVLLLVDSTAAVGVRLPTGDVVVAAGQGMTATGMSEKMRLEYVDPNTEIKVGDPLVTSGLDHSTYPPGIPVGRVAEIESGSRDMRKSVTAQAFVVPKRLDHVVVLPWSPS